MKGKAVSDRTHAREVRKRERLVSERNCCDVVPTREILRADHCNTAARKHTPQLADEVIEPPDVLNHLIRMDDVEARVFERPACIEVIGDDMEASLSGDLCALVDELDAAHVLPRDAHSAAYDVRPRAVVTTDVEEESVRIIRQRIENPRPVCPLGFSPAFLHQLRKTPPASGHGQHAMQSRQ